MNRTCAIFPKKMKKKVNCRKKSKFTHYLKESEKDDRQWKPCFTKRSLKTGPAKMKNILQASDQNQIENKPVNIKRPVEISHTYKKMNALKFLLPAERKQKRNLAINAFLYVD